MSGKQYASRLERLAKEWRAAGRGARERVEVARRLVSLTDEAMYAAVDEYRDAGASWREVAWALDLGSRQAAFKRFARHGEQPDPVEG